LGARMIGAGFGGSGIAILESGKKEEFKQILLDGARRRRHKNPDIYDVEIGEGAIAYEI